MRILRTKTFSQKIADSLRITSIGRVISVFAIIVIGVGITVTAWQIQKPQEIRQRASEDPLISPTTNTGFLKVLIVPYTKSITTIIKSPEGNIVMQGEWGINWKKIEAGNYYVSFSNTKTPGLKTPKTTPFTIISGENTEIIADFTNGRTTITYH